MVRIISLCLLLIGFTSVLAQKSIHDAVKSGNFEAIESLIKQGHSIDSLDADGFAPMHYASEKKTPKMIEYLFNHRANPDVKDKLGMTPLLWAAKLGDFESYQKLMAVGANWNAKIDISDNGITKRAKYALDFAEEGGHQQIVNYIKDEEFPVTGQVVIRLVKEGEWDKFYKAAGKDYPLDERDYNGATPLMYAANTHYYERWMKYLLDKGADPLKKDYNDQTVLHYAARYGCYDVIELLTDLKVDINAKDAWGNTPLLLAAWNSGVNTFTNLLEEGADPNVKSNEGDGPMNIVLYKKNDEKALDILKQLVKFKADVNLIGKNGAVPLLDAIYYERFDCLNFLLENGANVNYTDFENWTPVRQAVNLKNAETAAKILELLLEKNPTNINVKYDGKTALTVAKEKEFSDCVEMLIKAGATE